MGFINKRDNSNDKQASKSTIITTGVKIEGCFDFIAKVFVFGQIFGKIRSNNTVVIGKDGVIKGDVEAKRLIVDGNFEGNADCESVEILEGGVFVGNIASMNLIIEKNAFFEGKNRKKSKNFFSEQKQEERQKEEIAENTDEEKTEIAAEE